MPVDFVQNVVFLLLLKLSVLARKTVDKSQNKAIAALSKRLKMLEGATIERKYLTSHDAFYFGGLGSVKSRYIHRYGIGTYEGMTTAALFGTTGPRGDKVYARYMIVDVKLTCSNTGVPSAEVDPTAFSMWILKARKENDKYAHAYTGNNSLNDSDIITNQVHGQSFVNPKGWKIVKSKTGMIGGINSENNGFGIAHRRYRFKIPLNKNINLQPFDSGDALENYPTEAQDLLWFVICANGSSTDLQEP